MPNWHGGGSLEPFHFHCRAKLSSTLLYLFTLNQLLLVSLQGKCVMLLICCTCLAIPMTLVSILTAATRPVNYCFCFCILINIDECETIKHILLNTLLKLAKAICLWWLQLVIPLCHWLTWRKSVSLRLLFLSSRSYTQPSCCICPCLGNSRMQKLHICTESQHLLWSGWDTKPRRCLSLARLLILPLSMCHADFLLGTKMLPHVPMEKGDFPVLIHCFPFLPSCTLISAEGINVPCWFSPH